MNREKRWLLKQIVSKAWEGRGTYIKQSLSKTIGALQPQTSCWDLPSSSLIPVSGILTSSSLSCTRGNLASGVPAILSRLWGYCCPLRLRPQIWSLTPTIVLPGRSALQFLHHWLMCQPQAQIVIRVPAYCFFSLTCQSSSCSMPALLHPHWACSDLPLKREGWGLGYLCQPFLT